MAIRYNTTTRNAIGSAAVSNWYGRGRGVPTGRVATLRYAARPSAGPARYAGNRYRTARVANAAVKHEWRMVVGRNITGTNRPHISTLSTGSLMRYGFRNSDTRTMGVGRMARRQLKNRATQRMITSKAALPLAGVAFGAATIGGSYGIYKGSAILSGKVQANRNAKRKVAATTTAAGGAGGTKKAQPVSKAKNGTKVNPNAKGKSAGRRNFRERRDAKGRFAGSY